MLINNISHRAVAWSSATADTVVWVDQTALPFSFQCKESNDPEDLVQAIILMEVRGAPSIGATAAYGLALAYANDKAAFNAHWLPRFRQTRPTAVNLFHACNYMENLCGNLDVSLHTACEAAQQYADAEVSRNKLMGNQMAALLAIGNRRIQTHCNAGWLAAVDWGTATSGIYQLAQQGEQPYVLVDETRPRFQGAKLTAWELQQQGIPCHIQVDAAAAWMMAQGKTDVVVVGADRIAANGDVANKIGTYMLALAAKAHGIPFYVAAPMSTWDQHCATGSMITIEDRSALEVLAADGLSDAGKHSHIQLMSADLPTQNPAFDVTPFDLITGIVSEKGIYTGAGHWT